MQNVANNLIIGICNNYFHLISYLFLLCANNLICFEVCLSVRLSSMSVAAFTSWHLGHSIHCLTCTYRIIYLYIAFAVYVLLCPCFYLWPPQYDAILVLTLVILWVSPQSRWNGMMMIWGQCSNMVLRTPPSVPTPNQGMVAGFKGEGGGICNWSIILWQLHAWHNIKW